MDAATARLLTGLTSDFYRRFAGSFSDTRQGAWAGWDRCVRLVCDGLSVGAPAAGASARDLTVLDLACGNLRFERFLAQALAPVQAHFYALDNCDALMDAGADAPDAEGAAAPLDVRLVHLDVMDALLAGGSAPCASTGGKPEGTPLARALGVPPCDLSVCFGFMHHVPLPEQRMQVLRALVEKTRPGGMVAVSLWRFLDDAAFTRKARTQHERASAALGLPPLPEDDCVLGWQNVPGAYRYCHSFTDAEIDALVESVGDVAAPLERFRADGKTGVMNDYVVLRVL